VWKGGEMGRLRSHRGVGSRESGVGSGTLDAFEERRRRKGSCVSARKCDEGCWSSICVGHDHHRPTRGSLR